MKLAPIAGLAASACLVVMTLQVPADQPPVGGPVTGKALMLPSPIAVRVAHADIVITGKVTKIEDKTVSALSFPGTKDKVEYQIAVVKVDDPILNAKGIKEVRVGFIPATPGVVRPGGYRPPTLTEDEEALLFLKKHFDADFYTYPAYFDVVKKANNAFYEKEIEEAKKDAKLFADPMAGLKSKEAGDRFVTAAMLVERYRVPGISTTPAKQEPIDAAESKLILEALRDADWAPPPPAPAGSPPGWKLTPQYAFGRLALTKDDTWTPPTDPNKLADTAKEWLKENAGTYRIKRFVPETKEEKKDK